MTLTFPGSTVPSTFKPSAGSRHLQAGGKQPVIEQIHVGLTPNWPAITQSDRNITVVIKSVEGEKMRSSQMRFSFTLNDAKQLRDLLDHAIDLREQPSPSEVSGARNANERS